MHVLLYRCVDQEVRVNYGETVLLIASQLHYWDIGNALLVAGGEAHATGNDGITPFHFAVLAGHADITKTQLTRGRY